MYRTILSMFIFISLIAVAAPAHAAEFRVMTDTKAVSNGASFEARFVVDTHGESINAFEGVVTFPGELLIPLEVREGGSIVNFWIEKPRVATTSRSIPFSGIIPGGSFGGGPLFSIVFRAIKPGSAQIGVANAKALENNGAGSSARITTADARVTISNVAASPQSVPPIEDTDRPEPFTPAIAHDPSLFGGKYFLVFATQDKRSGIDHYEVCEGSMRQCVVAESPYLLHNQELNRKIFVRAVDRANNERIATVPAFMHLPWYQNLLLLAILGTLICALFILRRFLWRNFVRSH